ncbi:uncharacterized protein MKZ38_002877 [Zalerion maritima]|uniref:DUF1993 domain-containing protein n=1 Tax=Zalerion maritima TaxID=339359 RepID=A0AAD5WXQ9_9PEZI|nr:uncharacterized protein MKZ38_002877 [Zalerion maritima]
MPTLHYLTVPTLTSGLQTLKHVITKATTNTPSTLDISKLPEMRLAPDMLTFKTQIQIACSEAHKILFRLGKANPSGATGELPSFFPAFKDNETTVEDLVSRIDATIKDLDACKEGDLRDENVKVDLKLGPLQTQMTGTDYVLGYILPDFFFHLQTAYCILRMNGVEIGKKDYLQAFMSKTVSL